MLLSDFLDQFQPKQKLHGAGDYGAAVYKDDPEVFQKGKGKTPQHTKGKCSLDGEIS